VHEAENRLLMIGEDVESNALLLWRGDERWAAYADGYKKAADILVAHVLETTADQDFLVYPITFLYRHYLELRLKGLIIIGQELSRSESRARARRNRGRKGHNLKDLWKETRQLVERVWPDGPKGELDDVEGCIRRFADVDASSQAFRYPSLTDRTQSLRNLTHINLRNLSEVMGRVADTLEPACDGMVEMLRTEREAEDYLR
jgi:hypothetical protein